MLSASFSTLFYWTVFGLVAVYLLCLVHRELDRRDRVRRMRERRLMRAYRDNIEPKRWTT